MIPLVNLKAQAQALGSEINAAIEQIIAQTAFIGGRPLQEFEEAFADYCGVRYAAGVSNGTDALHLALRACNIGPGDEVITVPNTFIATTEAITMVGATIRFVDIDPETYNIDPQAITAALSPKTRAIIPVHLYGRPAEMDAILRIARDHDLKVISDAAQAHGAMYKGEKLAALGDACCYSFYPGKNLGAYGDAGAVVTNNEAIAQAVRKLRNHGREEKYTHDVEGFNSRMDALQAAILSVKLRHLEVWTERRRALAALYNELLTDVPGVELLSDPTDMRAVYHLYVVRLQQRELVQQKLREDGIATGVHYPIPLHLQQAYAHLGLGEGSFPVAERYAKEILSLPLCPELKDDEVRYIVDKLRMAMQ